MPNINQQETVYQYPELQRYQVTLAKNCFEESHDLLLGLKSLRKLLYFNCYVQEQLQNAKNKNTFGCLHHQGEVVLFFFNCKHMLNPAQSGFLPDFLVYV